MNRLQRNPWLAITILATTLTWIIIIANGSLARLFEGLALAPTAITALSAVIIVALGIYIRGGREGLQSRLGVGLVAVVVVLGGVAVLIAARS